MARRGYLTLASTRPSQLARFLSSHMALVVEIYKGTAGTGHFRIRQLQPDQPDELAYKLILAHGYNFTGWLSVVNFWSWLVGQPTCGEVPEENLLHFFWHCIGGSEEGLLDSVRFVAGKSPLKTSKLWEAVRLKSSALVRRGVEELNYGLWLTLCLFAGPPSLMRPESAITSSDAPVSGGADAVSVEESPRANLERPGKPKGRPASVLIIAISLYNEIGGLA